MTEPSQGELPTELRAFVYSCIDAVEQVEILSLLARADRTWTARTVGHELGLPDTLARTHLETLAARGLLQVTTGTELTYGYAPKTTVLRRYADQLTDFYNHSRIAVLRFVASNPWRLRRFSNAFKLRDEE